MGYMASWLQLPFARLCRLLLQKLHYFYLHSQSTDVQAVLGGRIRTIKNDTSCLLACRQDGLAFGGCYEIRRFFEREEH